MRSTRLGIAMATAIGLALSGCISGGDSDYILKPKPGGTLDITNELSAAPTRPIELPGSVASLPPPGSGQRDRAQQDPAADAVAVLGGSSGARTTGIPESDFQFVSHVSRMGVNSNIRLVLEAEDREFRRGRRGRVLERWFNVNLYLQAYQSMTLDQQAELERLRKANIRVPNAPPTF